MFLLSASFLKFSSKTLLSTSYGPCSTEVTVDAKVNRACSYFLRRLVVKELNGPKKKKYGKVVRAVKEANTGTTKEVKEGQFMEREMANVEGFLETMSLRGVSKGKDRGKRKV